MSLRSALSAAILMLVAALASAQGWWDGKPYSSWSKEEVDKMLDDSPWGREVRESIARITYVNPGISGIERAYDRLSFHVGLLTSKPIRMALARRAVLLDPASQGTDWGKYIDLEDTRNIVVVVRLTATPVDSPIAVVVSGLLEGYKTPDVESRVSLAAGEKKVRLEKYDPLGENGYGIKFIFPRNLPDGKPLIAPADKELKFDLIIPIPKEQSDTRVVAVKMRWDLRKMTYQGKLTF